MNSLLETGKDRNQSDDSPRHTGPGTRLAGSHPQKCAPTPPLPHKGYPQSWQERLTRKEFTGQRHRVSSRGKAVMTFPCKERKKTMNELMEDLYTCQEKKPSKKLTTKKSAEKKIIDQVYTTSQPVLRLNK